jgi:prepilin peptidase CpaA
VERKMTWFLALIVAGIAAGIDVKSRRIPNWLTIPGFFMGLTVNQILYGWNGLKWGLAGALAMLAVLLPIVLLRGLGAGDWKLMGALGATLGLRNVIYVFLTAIMIAGLMAVVQMIWQRRVAETLSNMWELLRGFFVYGLKPHPEIQLGNARASHLPFGVAAAAATLICYGIGTIRL